MKNTERLGWYIRVARRERGVTQSQLAKHMRTKQASIARAETRGCSLTFAEKAVGFLGFEITNIALRAKDPFQSGLKFLG
jgi:transcriptional regulator with XRE-family HTH domain